jgi:hypothetical protein
VLGDRASSGAGEPKKVLRPRRDVRGLPRIRGPLRPVIKKRKITGLECRRKVSPLSGGAVISAKLGLTLRPA